MVPEIKPQPFDIESHLHHITRRWGEIGQPVMVELVFLSAEDKAEVKHVARYRPDQIGQAAEDAAAMNALGINVYCAINPVDANNQPKAGHRASREHIVGAFYHWADADDAQAAENIRNFVGPKCTMHVLTGTQPCMRPHVYWELVEFTRNLPEWEARQKAIAATLGTDPKVTDAPRIMRLAGSINWPKPSKRAKGYIAEVTTLRVYDPLERPPVSAERMARAFVGVAAGAAAGGLQIDTGTGATAMDRALATAQIKAGENWRGNVMSLVASYIARGWTDDEILDRCEPFTLPGYTVADTREDVAGFIVWTRDQEARKGGKFAQSPVGAPGQFRDLTDSEKDAISPALFKPWKWKDLSRIPAPAFVYSDFYARGYTSVTLAPPKVGKSMLGLAEAIDMATGRGFLTGVRRDPLKVVYYNAEDDQDVIDGRVSALLTHYGISQGEIEDRIFPTSGVEADAFYMISGQEGVINEPLFVSIEKFIAETGADALIFDPLQDLSRSPETNEVFRLLGQRLRRLSSSTGVALGLIHHTRKIAPGSTPSIDDGRGGSALRGTARFNRLLLSMSEDEGAKAGVKNHRHYLRIGDMESNLAPPSADVNRWFEKVSVETPSGAHVGAIQPWEWPDAFDGVSKNDAARVRAEVARMPEPPRENIRSGAWIGAVIADCLGMDIATASGKARVKAILAKWLETDILRISEAHDARAGRPVKVVIAGDNNPMTEVSS